MADETEAEAWVRADAMTVQQLIAELSKYPQDTPIWVSADGAWGPAAKVRLDDRGMLVIDEKEQS